MVDLLHADAMSMTDTNLVLTNSSRQSAPAPWHSSPAAPGTNSKAVASLVLGIVWLGGLGSLLALILGYIARREVNDARGSQTGSGLAVAGIVLGWVGMAGLAAIVVILLFASATMSAQAENAADAVVQSELRNAALAQEVHFTSYGTYATGMDELAEWGFIPSGGVDLQIVAESAGYCLQADSETGRVYSYDSASAKLEERPCR